MFVDGASPKQYQSSSPGEWVNGGENARSRNQTRPCLPGRALHSRRSHKSFCSHSLWVMLADKAKETTINLRSFSLPFAQSSPRLCAQRLFPPIWFDGNKAYSKKAWIIPIECRCLSMRMVRHRVTNHCHAWIQFTQLDGTGKLMIICACLSSIMQANPAFYYYLSSLDIGKYGFDYSITMWFMVRHRPDLLWQPRSYRLPSESNQNPSSQSEHFCTINNSLIEPSRLFIASPMWWASTSLFWYFLALACAHTPIGRWSCIIHVLSTGPSDWFGCLWNVHEHALRSQINHDNSGHRTLVHASCRL